jgi:hypothetical protein
VEPMRPEVREKTIASGKGTASERSKLLDEYQELLAVRQAQDPLEARSPDAKSARAANERLAALQQILFADDEW